MADNFLKALDESFKNGAGEYAKALNFMMIESDKARESALQKSTPSIIVESIVVDEKAVQNVAPVVGKEEIVNDGDER